MNVLRWRVAKFFENFTRERKLGFRCHAMPISMTSMPMFAMYKVKVERIILSVKIVNQYFERKECCFDGGSVRIKGMKTLYLSVVHSKHTASYTV